MREKIGRYTLLGKIATGGMAEVFLARHDGPEGFAKTVIVKRILEQFTDDADFVKMFLNEARIAALVNHPNVVSTLELGREEGRYFMALEYVDGCTLKRFVRRSFERGELPPPEYCARIVADACAGLHFAHELTDPISGVSLEIIHRDISPDNLLLSYSGLVKVSDFGIAKAANTLEQTRIGQIKGKLSYLSPERVRNEPADRRADIWSLGVVLYWMCSGQRPFQGPTENEVIEQIQFHEPPPLRHRAPEVPDELERIVLRALAKKPEERYQTARELQIDLERWLVASRRAVVASELADLMERLFPLRDDPDRRAHRALISGEISNPGSAPTALGSVARPGEGAPAPTVAASRRAGGRTLGLSVLGALGVALATLANVILFRRAQTANETRDSQPATPRPVQAAIPEPRAAPAPAAPRAALPQGPPPSAASLPAAAPRLGHPTRDLGARQHRGEGSHAPMKKAASRSPAPSPPVSVPHPRANGTLAFRVEPWGVVFVDGKSFGPTPFAPIELPAGRHQIRIVNEGLGVRRELSVDVSEGETLLVKQRL